MISLFHILPSFVVALDGRLEDPDYREAFLDAVSELLSGIRPDGGADSDRIYTSGAKLSQGGAWKHIDAKTLAERTRSAPAETVTIFSEALPKDFGKAFLAHYRILNGTAAAA